MTNDITLNPADAKGILKLIIERKDKDALWEWFKEHLSMEIPRVAICDHHCAPFDFVADYIFGEIKDAIVLANRSGGKTMNFGMLDAVMAFASDSTEIATVGAIQFQADKAYQYFKDFSNKFPFNSNILRFTRKQTDCHNDSKVQVLTGTMSGVNSPHPQILFLDEIDLMAWQVLQQALSMPQSKAGVEARTVLTSTRKFGAGPMQRLLDEAEARGYKVYQWCIWEVVEPLPLGNPTKMTEIRKEFPILPDRIEQAEGYYTWSDTMSKHRSLDSETWEVEWLCSKPGMEGIIYGSAYSDENNLLAGWSPVKDGKLRDGYFYLCEDFGFGEGHPDVVLPIWIPPEFDRAIIFDELYMTNYGDEAVWSAVTGMLSSYGMNVRDHIRGWACDYHGLTEIDFRKRKGAPVLDKHPDAGRYEVWNGIALVKKLLETGRLMITDKCINLRLEFMSYKKKKNLDGTYSKVIVKQNDHGPDGIRYFVVKMFDAIARNAYDKSEEKAKPQAVRDPSLLVNTPPPPIPQTQGDKPITAGMLNMKF